MRKIKKQVDVEKVTNEEVTLLLNIKTSRPEILIDRSQVKVYIAFRGDPMVNAIRRRINVTRPIYEGYEASVGRIDYLDDNDNYYMVIKLKDDLLLKE